MAKKSALIRDLATTMHCKNSLSVIAGVVRKVSYSKHYCTIFLFTVRVD